MSDRLLRIKDVADMTGLSRPTIYRFIHEQGFPKPVKPGGEASRWVEREVQEWIAAQVAKRDALDSK